MVCSCFRGQKDLDDVSAPIEPAVPKPAPVSNGPQSNLAQLRHASKQHLTPSASSSRSVHTAVPNNAPAPTSGDLSQQGTAAPSSAGPDAGDAQAGSEPQAAARKRPTIVIPGSPSSPPAPPKGGHWNVSPVQQEGQRNQQPEIADVQDIEVDLDEVQELSPIPTSTPTPASGNGTPENMFHRVQGYQPSPSNLGPHRSRMQSSSADATTEKDDDEEDEEEPEEPGEHDAASRGIPPGSPPEAFYSHNQQAQTHEQLQQQLHQSPARFQPHGSHSNVEPMSARGQSDTPVKSWASSALQENMQEHPQQQQLLSPAHLRPNQDQQLNLQDQQQQQLEESSDWDDDEKSGQAMGSLRKQEAHQSSWDESSSPASTPAAHQQQPQRQPQSWRSNGTWSDKQLGSAAKLGSESQRSECSSLSEDEPAVSPAGVSHAPPDSVGSLPKTTADVASTPSASPHKVSSTRNDKPGWSPQPQHPAGVTRSPSRRTAPGPHAPKRPSPLGGGDTPRRGLGRQISNLSDCSDLSLPGEYERYGGGSSEDEEAADRQYEQAIALAGGQVAPGATARTTASNNVTPGPAQGAPSITTTPRIVGTVSPPAPDSSGLTSGLGPTARSTGFANPIWGEGEDEDSGSPEQTSQAQSARPPPTASRFQKMYLAAQATSPHQAARGVELDFDSHSDSDSDWDSDDGTSVRPAPSSGRRMGMQSFPQEDDDAEGKDLQGTPGRAESIKWTGVYIGPAGDSETSSPQPQSSVGGAIPMQSLAAAAAAAAATTTAIGAATSVSATATTTPTGPSPSRPFASTTYEPATTSASVTTSPPGAPDRALGSDTKTVAAPPVTSTTAPMAPPPKAPVNPTTVSSSSPSKPPPPSARQPPAAASDNGVKSTATTPAKASTAPLSKTSAAKAPIPTRTSLSTPAATAPKQHAAATVSPNTSASNNIPHFMMPTQSASAHRRSSEDGSTLNSANGNSSGSSGHHPSAAVATTRSSNTSINTSSVRVSAVKLMSPATSAALSRPPSGPSSLTRTPSGRQIVGHNSGTPPAAPKPVATATTTATTTPSAAGVGGKAPTTTGTTASKSAASGGTSVAAPHTKPSPATASRTTAAPSASTKPTTATRAAAPSGKAAAGTSDGASTASSHASKPPGGTTSATVRASQPLQPSGAVGNSAKLASADGANGTSTRTDPPPEAASQREVVAPKAAGQEPTAPAAAVAAPTPTPASAPAPPPSSGTGLPFGEWRVVRLKKEMRCCAGDGTVEQETHDGQMEVFKCEETLQPGALAAVISHSILPSGAATPQPKTWVFCPDPLCMESKPLGSDLPHWPPKIILAGGVKVTRAEYDHIKELGLDVTLPVKAPAAPTAG